MSAIAIQRYDKHKRQISHNAINIWLCFAQTIHRNHKTEKLFKYHEWGVVDNKLINYLRLSDERASAVVIEFKCTIV